MQALQHESVCIALSLRQQVVATSKCVNVLPHSTTYIYSAFQSTRTHLERSLVKCLVEVTLGNTQGVLWVDILHKLPTMILTDCWPILYYDRPIPRHDKACSHVHTVRTYLVWGLVFSSVAENPQLRRKGKQGKKDQRPGLNFGPMLYCRVSHVSHQSRSGSLSLVSSWQRPSGHNVLQLSD